MVESLHSVFQKGGNPNFENFKKGGKLKINFGGRKTKGGKDFHK